MLESLRSFGKVQEACFGQELKEGYEQRIKEFSQVYRSLEDKRITPKVHIVEHHIIDFFRETREKEHGLGFYSEQGFEAMHHDMKQEWDRVKINDRNHSDLAKRLLDFVIAYNGRYI